MSFQVPSTGAGSSGFSFNTQSATAGNTTKQTFSFSGGGDAENAKLTTLSLDAQPAATAASTTAPISVTSTTGVAGNTLVANASSSRTSETNSLKSSATNLGSFLTNTTSACGVLVNLTTATKTTDSSAIAHSSQLTYNQLEEHINKWTLEFEEQEKMFAEQATQINAWDKILINNNQKILELNDAVQKVKCDQQLLEQELEFIDTQHKELEESIGPLQKEFSNLPQVDVERSQTYLLAENLDTQLKQMSEDLKEIIDNLNESNKTQDNSDPIIQIGKILNAHMSSLQWIESASTSICNKLDDISKMHELQKREANRYSYYK